MLAVLRERKDDWALAYRFASVNSLRGGQRPQDLPVNEPERIVGAAEGWPAHTMARKKSGRATARTSMHIGIVGGIPDGIHGPTTIVGHIGSRRNNPLIPG
ncbi:hypothetical protein [Bradyrhizobium sp. AS23.2]|uniref:hypothetical protein n=1 Tax=Bradyrhizobium sp. AS23.2 TaxID=1680155 RepID=UPI0014305B00|nr:hypothetical protein [Bradyrhizobium sp. AS23.2]